MKRSFNSSRSDNQIVKKVLESKDSDLFGILYDRYVYMIYNRCLSFVRNPQEAEDLTHDIFLKAYIKLGTYQTKSKFSTWLYSLAINFCIDYSRKRELKISDIDVSTMVEYQNPDSIEESLISIKVDQLSDILEMISPEEKMILLLKYQDELSVDELSQLLNVGESAVKMRLSRARQKVVFLYENEYK